MSENIGRTPEWREHMGTMNESDVVAHTIGALNAEINRLNAELAQVRQERDERNQWLAECYRLSGADPDGNEDWRLALQAVAEVRRLRHDHDVEKRAPERLES